MNTGFKLINTTKNDAEAKIELIEHICGFVKLGLEKYGFKESNGAWWIVKSTLQSSLGFSALNGVGESLDTTRIRDRLMASYYDNYENLCDMLFGEIVQPVSVTTWAEEDLLVADRYKEAACRSMEEPSVDGALRMAWMNMGRARQRLVAWMSLGEMLENTQEGRDRNGMVYLEFEKVSKTIQAEVMEMERNVLMFSLLKGGEAADKARKWAIKSVLKEDNSVMEYLKLDGELVSRWDANEEEEFRKSIFESANKK